MASVGSVSIDLTLGTEKFDKQVTQSFSKLNNQIGKSFATLNERTASSFMRVENSSEKASTKINDTLNKALEKTKSTLNDVAKTGVSNVPKTVEKVSKNVEKIVRNSNKNVTSTFRDASKNNEKVILASNKNITSSFTSMAKKVSALLLSVFAVRKIINFGKECVELGSNLIEVQNIVDVAFGSMSKDIDDWAKNSIKNMGMSEKEAKQMAGVFGSMAKSVGFSVGESAEMSKTLTQLSADIASFYNIDYDKAYEKVKSVFTFESKPMKELGVLINDTTLNQYALEKGLNKTTKQMTMQEKVALRYQLVLERLAHVSGDFRRTEKTWANQTRILDQQLEKLKTTIGQGLINALTPVIYYINVLVEKLQVLGDKFMEFSKKTFGDNLGKMGGILQQVSDTNADEALESVGEEAEKSSKALKKTAFGFDELNKLDAPDSGGGSSSVEEVQEETKANEQNNKKLDDKNNILDKIIKKANLLKDAFKNGFKMSFSDEEFDSILDSIKTKIGNIIKNLKEIKTPELSFKIKFTEINIAETLGQIIGTATQVGMSLINNYVGTIDKFLEDEKGNIEQFALDILDSFNSILDSIGSIFTDIGDIISNFLNSEDVQQLGANLLEIIINPLMAGFDIILEDFSVFLDGIATIIHDNKAKIEEVINGLVSFLLSITTTIKETIDSLIVKVKEVNEQYIKPSIEAIMNSLNDLVNSVLTSWTTYIQPILDEFAEMFDKVMKQYVEPLLESAIELIGVVVDALTQLWVNVLQPICKWLIDTLFKTIKWLWDNTKGIIETAVETVATLIKGVIDTFSGLIEFLTGVFTGDVQKTSDGLKKIGQGLYEFFHDGILKFDEFVEQVGQLLINFVKDSIMLIVNFIADKINEGMEKSKEQMNNLHDWFVEKFTKIKEDFFNFGANIIDGFIGGIKDTWEKAKDTVGELADGIKDKFKDLLGIHSPSRVFKEFGRYLDEGLEIGIKTNADDIYSQVSSLSDNIQANFTPRLAFLGKEESSSNQIIYPDDASSSNESTIMSQNAKIIELLEAIKNKESDIYMDTTKVGKQVTKYQQNEARRLS